MNNFIENRLHCGLYWCFLLQLRCHNTMSPSSDSECPGGHLEHVSHYCHGGQIVLPQHHHELICFPFWSDNFDATSVFLIFGPQPMQIWWKRKPLMSWTILITTCKFYFKTHCWIKELLLNINTTRDIVYCHTLIIIFFKLKAIVPPNIWWCYGKYNLQGTITLLLLYVCDIFLFISWAKSTEPHVDNNFCAK